MNLYTGIKNRDDRAFKYLYENVFLYMKNYVLQNKGNEEDVRDLFQEALIALWDNIANGKYHHTDDKALVNYFITICKYKWMDHQKSARNKYTSALGERMDIAEEPPAEALLNAEEIKTRLGIFAQLDTTCQKVLTMFYCDEKTMQQIAAELGWAADSAKNAKYRCMEKMKLLVKTLYKPGNK